MKYVLDTNAVSALMKGTPSMLERLAVIARNDVLLPQPVLAELEYGVARLPRSKRQAELAVRLERIQAEVGRVTWTDEVSRAFGEIKTLLEKKGQRIEDFDVAIAAHALASKATLVTADGDHMTRVPGLKVEDWLTG